MSTIEHYSLYFSFKLQFYVSQQQKNRFFSDNDSNDNNDGDFVHLEME